jgi:hypothetical protein
MRSVADRFKGLPTTPNCGAIQFLQTRRYAMTTVGARPTDALTSDQRRVIAVTDRYGAKDTIIKSTDTPFFPWVEGFELRLIRIDNRTGTFTVDLRSLMDTWLGKHRHRGGVVATTLQGAWNYAEYDWVAQVGDYVHEFPGVCHTLHFYADTVVRFEVAGALEFLHDDETLKSLMDAWDFLDMYIQWCKENNQTLNEGVLF